MSEEAAFLQALESDPGDDLTRLVYADWLDERGDARGRYLRLEIEASQEAWNQDREPGQVAELLALRPGFYPDWLARAGKRWDLQLCGFESNRIAFVARAFRDVTSWGYKEIIVWCKSAPCCVLTEVDLAQAQAGLRVFRDLVPGQARVEVRPTLLSGPVYEILIGWNQEQEVPVVRALLAQFLALDPAQVVLPPASPCRLRSGLSGREAFALRRKVEKAISLLSQRTPEVILRRTD
jgi:uncharacterized protein (TIGR02996 family)